MKKKFPLNLLFSFSLAIIVLLPHIVYSSVRPQLRSNRSLPTIVYTWKTSRQWTSTVFAYSSTVGQTDLNPWVTASGVTVHEGIVANNCLPFGTKVRFPKLFGDREFVVEDRMAPRHGCYAFDIWQPSVAAARQIGRVTATVEIY